ncbi:hypothetical protein Cni_G01729 [Canna indica]|uniref:Uncharacterized protein n=1 Tax=Canna indica TaxID=4628 RepID=A0AAQ3JNC3_9LILI|nr:hypothetical protein Cni_G01729 [Canna indica]
MNFLELVIYQHTWRAAIERTSSSPRCRCYDECHLLQDVAAAASWISLPRSLGCCGLQGGRDSICAAWLGGCGSVDGINDAVAASWMRRLGRDVTATSAALMTLPLPLDVAAS